MVHFCCWIFFSGSTLRALSWIAN